MSSTSEAIRVPVPERARALVAPGVLDDALACALRESGIELVPTALGDIGAEIVAEHADMVFVDASVEAMRLCRKVKAAHTTHFVPVVVWGAADSEARRRACAEGADLVAPVPADTEEVVARAWAMLRTYHLFKLFENRRQDLKLRRDWGRYLVHDLGNALSRATYGISALRQRLSKADPGALPDLDELELSIDRSASMLRDVLDVDRLRRGRLPVRPELLDVADLVRRVAERFTAFARELDVPIEIVGAQARARADRILLERVVANLVDNAIRFSPAGRPVTVEVAPAKAEVHVVVTNHGPPVPKADREKIFRPFAKHEQNLRQAGTGLGLAFARLAVEVQGGRIWVEDAAHGGPAFVVVLPAAG